MHTQREDLEEADSRQVQCAGELSSPGKRPPTRFRRRTAARAAEGGSDVR
jgi:hypothetical protein